MKVALLLCVLLPAVLCVMHVDIPDTAGCPVSAGEVTTDGRVFLVSDQTHCLGAGVDISTLHFVAWSEWEMSRVGIAIGPSEIVSFGGAYNKTLDTLFVCHEETFKEDIVLFIPDFTVRDCIWLAKGDYSTFACVGFSHTENLDGWLTFNGLADHASCEYFTPSANFTFHPFMAEIGTQWWLPHNAWFDGDELHVAVVSEITNDIHVAVFDFGVPPHDDPALLYVRLLDENIYEVNSAMVAYYHSHPYLFVGCDLDLTNRRTVPAVVFADLSEATSKPLNLHLPVDQGEVAGIWLKENQLAVLQKDAGIITKYDMAAQPTVRGYAELPHPRNNVALDLFETENYFLVPRREWKGMSVEIVHMDRDFCDRKCGANATCSLSKCECVPGYEHVEDTFECLSSAEIHKPECSCPSKSGTIATLSVFFVLSLLGNMGLAYVFVVKPKMGGGRREFTAI